MPLKDHDGSLSHSAYHFTELSHTGQECLPCLLLNVVNKFWGKGWGTHLEIYPVVKCFNLPCGQMFTTSQRGTYLINSVLECIALLSGFSLALI